MTKKLKIFIIAGESSGDNLGVKLCKQLKKQASCEFLGVGGPKMTAEGMKSIFPMSEISLMGFSEVIPHIFRVLKLIKKTVAAAKKFNPDVIVTIDSPGFCFRVIKKLAGLKARKIHYVAPSIWIKPKRVHFLEKYYDKVLALLPFEPEYFKDSQVKCEFIGHPILEDGFDKGDGDAFRSRHNIANEAVVMTVMTGSREGEYRVLLPIFMEALNSFVKQNKVKNFIAAFPLTSDLQKSFINSFEGEMNFEYITVSGNEKKDLYASSDFALVKSGTSSLEIAIAKVPMVVAYKMNRMTAWIIRNIFNYNSFASIINILANKMIIPELIQEECTAENISIEMAKLFTKREAEAQVKECQKYIEKLKPDASMISSKEAAYQVLRF